MSFQSAAAFDINNSYNWVYPNNQGYIYDQTQTTFSNDQQHIKKWISSLPPRPENVKISKCEFKINQIRKSFNNVLTNCYKIRELEATLRQNVSILSAKEWSEKINTIKSMQEEISKELSSNNEDVCKQVKRKVMKRISKRARLKRNKAVSKEKKKQDKKVSELKRKEIDCEFQRMKEELEMKAKKDEHRVFVDNVLRDVNKRKATARKYLSLLDDLLQLREAREKTARGRGEAVNSSTTQEFSFNIEKLKEVWKHALNEYSVEESNLRLKLPESEPDEAKIVPKNIDTADKISSAWNLVLFGETYENAEGNIDNFLCVRRQWDRYISYEEGASAMPIGWVVPPSNVSQQWKKFLSQND